MRPPSSPYLAHIGIAVLFLVLGRGQAHLSLAFLRSFTGGEPG